MPNNSLAGLNEFRLPGHLTSIQRTLRRLDSRLEEYGTTLDAVMTGRPHNSRSAEKIAAVAEDVSENPGGSISYLHTELWRKD